MQLTSTNQLARVDLDNGAALTELKLEIRNTPVTIISPESDYLFASSLLFPFPNRLANGTYQFEGVTYEFPLNDFGRPNALHGFVHDKKFQVEDEGDNHLKACFSYDGSLPYFPFPFTLRTVYTLEPGALTVDIEVINEAPGPMPFGFGWHPYFHAENTKAEMKLPAVTRFELDENFIPTGTAENDRRFSDFHSVEGVSLDDSFILDGTEYASFLRMPDGSILEIWQDPQFKYLQVYTPDDRMSVAIEPMTCGVDAWNKDGEIPRLEKGESFRGSFGVKLR